MTVPTSMNSRAAEGRRFVVMRNGSRFCRVLFVTLCVAAAGCSNNKFSDLQSYVEHVRATQKGHIEPLPKFKPFETYTYNDADKKDPFMPWPTETASVGKGGANGIRPDFKRRKESLEAFPLDSLKMVGTLDFDGHKWAVIKAPDGIVYHVKPGNYMGKNNGKITKVEHGMVVLEEIIPNGIGGWENRPARLAMKD